MIALLLAEGFEELEALAPLDYLRRAGADVKTVGITSRTVTGAHGVAVVADLLAEDVDFSDVSDVILPGGMPGTDNLDHSPFVDALLKAVDEKGGHLSAICAAPMVLGKRGYLRGKRATCFPGYEKHLDGATVSEAAAVTDGRITTGRGMECAVPFARELVKVLCPAPGMKRQTERTKKEPEKAVDIPTLIRDPLFMKAVDLTLEKKHPTVLYLQQALGQGFLQCIRYLDAMCELGVITDSVGGSPRTVLMKKDEWDEKKETLIRRYEKVKNEKRRKK